MYTTVYGENNIKYQIYIKICLRFNFKFLVRVETFEG